MRILAIEGALARCSAAVLADGKVAAEAAQDGPRGHPAVLPSMALSVLAAAHVAAAHLDVARHRAAGLGAAGAGAEALDAVAVGVGPGGFTGLRAAIALAEGIARAAGRPLVGVTTGEALAEALPAPLRDGRAIWAVVDNRRGRVVIECFPPGGASPDAPLVASLDALPAPAGPVLVIGDAAQAVAAALCARGDAAAASPGLPDAVAVARVAARRLAGALPPRDGAPLYAEPPAVRVPA